MSPESFTDFRGSSHIISHPHLVIVKIFVEKFGKVIGGVYLSRNLIFLFFGHYFQQYQQDV